MATGSPDRLVELGESVDDSLPLRIDRATNPFKDSRLAVKNLPVEPQDLTVTNPSTGEEKGLSIKLFEEPGNVRGTRRAISEIIKWANYVTNNRFVVVAADLAESINVEHGAIWDTFDPVANPSGSRLKAAIQEAGNRLHCHRTRRSVGFPRPRRARWRLGAKRHLRRVYPAYVSPVPCLEPAEPGQPVRYGRAAHSRRPLRSRDGG